MALALGGCYSGESASDAGESTSSSGADATSAAADETSAGDTADDDTGAPAKPFMPGPPVLPRLTQRQYLNSVEALLGPGLPVPPLEPDTNPYLFFTIGAASTTVSELGVQQYEEAAELFTGIVFADVARRDALVGCLPAAPGDACVSEFIARFGRRAYRRPLAADEQARWLTMATELANGDAWQGVRHAIAGMLQSPHFLYRVEASDIAEGTKIRLSGHEIASKLSYMLWNTMPDDELFAAAADGSLDDPKGVASQATRLLDHPRARDMVANFHYQLLKVDHYSDIYKDPVKFAAYSAEVNPLLASETLKFVDDVIFNDGDFATLLTAPYTFVNAKLAPFYGVQGDFGDDFVKVDLDPARRAGILTQLGFLMANAGAFENDPIHRGVFMNLQLLCTGLPPPPNMVPPLPPPVEGETLRERVDRHTGKGTCGEGCHGYLINPLGFAFEHYDPLGQWQTMDAGKPVDAAAEFQFGGVPQKYDGAVELAHLMADSDEAHKCYVAHFLEYGYARRPQKADQEFIDSLAAGSKDGTHTIKQIILELTRSDAFLNRAPVEE